MLDLKKAFLPLIVFLSLIGTNVNAVTSVRVIVDGMETDTLVQGTFYGFEALTTPFDTVGLLVIPDYNDNGLIDPGEESMLDFIEDAKRIIDNGEPPEEAIFFDWDDSSGIVLVYMVIHFDPGAWIVAFASGSDTALHPFTIIPPDPLMFSVSGQISIEGTTPPNPVFETIPLIAGDMEIPMLMYTLPDSMGNFSFNWPGEAAEIAVMLFLGPEPWDTFALVDDHITDFNINLPRGAAGISYFKIYVEGIESYTQTQGQMQAFEMDCGSAGAVFTTFYVDTDSNGVLDTYDPKSFALTFIDNHDEFPFDTDTTRGALYCDWFINFPPNHYIITANDGINTVTQTYTVRAPDSVTMSGSGRLTLEGITPPDTLLGDLTFVALSMEPLVAMLFITDNNGDFQFNWLGEAGEVMVVWVYDEYVDDYYYFELGYDIEEHLPSWEIEGHTTGLEIFVPLLIPDTAYFHGYIQGSDGEPVDADSLIKVAVTRPEFCGSSETLYVDIVEGNFMEEISLERCDLIWLNYNYYRIPDDYMQLPKGGFTTFDESSLDHEFNDILLSRNDTIWFYYSFYEGTAPIYIDLPIKLSHPEYGFTNALIPYDSIIAVGIHAESRWTPYNVQIDCELCLPETYQFWFTYDSIGRAMAILPGDTVNLVIRETEAVIAGTLFSATGEVITTSSVLTYYYMPGFATDLEVTTGIYEIDAFTDVLYYFIPRVPGFMTQPEQLVFTHSGLNRFNITLYPLDGTFWLYLATDSLAPEEENFQTLLTYDPTGDYNYYFVSSNQWIEVPIYSGFTEACFLEIGYPDWGAIFDRFVENNGEIEVYPGESIYVDILSAVAHYSVNWERDMEDQFGPEGSWAATNHYLFNYYDPTDSTIAYTYDPGGVGYLIPCLVSGYPIFQDTFNVRIEPAFSYVEEHGWLANPEGFLVGGDIRPDTIDVYYNYACYHFWLHLDGFPAFYLEEVSLPIDVTGVEEPEHPDHHFVTEFEVADEGEGNLFGYHELCDAVWTIRLPASLPMGFIPEITETSIVVTDPDTFDWPHNHMRIEVLWPEGLHGEIIKDPDVDPPIQVWNLYMQLLDFYTSDLVDEIRAFRYHDDVVYISPMIEPGDYFANLHCSGYPDELFIYPVDHSFSYSGGDHIIPVHYISRAYGGIHFNFTGVSSSEIAGSILLADITDEEAWFDITAEYRVSSTMLDLNFCEGEWLLTPPELLGYEVSPAETTLSIPEYWTEFEIDFNYTFTGDTFCTILGHLNRDEDDPSPIDFTEFYVTLYLSDGITPIRELYADLDGLFNFEMIPGGNYYLGTEYTGVGNAFVYPEFFDFHVDPGETLELDPIYVDNANASLIINFAGLQASDVTCELILASSDLPIPDETMIFPYNTFHTRDTFYLCDGIWTFYAPEFDTFIFAPAETTLNVDEATETFTINFWNTTHIPVKPILPDKLTLKSYPNPFNSTLNLNIYLPNDDRLSVDIINLKGEKIIEIHNGSLKKGPQVFTWNGNDAAGRTCVSGIYFAKLKTNQEMIITKILYLK